MPRIIHYLTELKKIRNDYAPGDDSKKRKLAIEALVGPRGDGAEQTDRLVDLAIAILIAQGRS
jgi:hypothetical protein